MTLLELVVALLMASAVLTVVAQRIGAPYPALLALAGAALAFVPGAPAPVLNPAIALPLFVAPVLMEAAYSISLRDLWRSWAPVGGLILALVLLTVAAVACVAKLMLPQMPWAVAITLGAIVAPPDASAAVSVLRQVSPPYRVQVILEGESLLNDAGALLIWRLGVAAALGGRVSAGWAAGTLALTALGGAAFGAVTGWGYAALGRRVGDVSVFVLSQFVAAFSVWLLAEHLDLSPVIATVAFGLVVAQRQGGRFGAEHRVASFTVWRVALYALNALAFILVGLQLRQVLARSPSADFGLLGFGAAILAVIVVVRGAAVMGYTAVSRRIARWLRRGLGGPRAAPALSYGGGVIVAWCGMRGIVTLAAALALPQGGPPGGADPGFAFRDQLIAAAFVVVLGTLVLQGLSLAPVIRWLRLPPDRTVEREIILARAEAARAALAVLDREGDTDIGPLRADLVARASDTSRAISDEAHLAALRLRLRAIAAQRRRLRQMWLAREIGDPAYRAVEDELDWVEGALRRQVASGERA